MYFLTQTLQHTLYTGTHAPTTSLFQVPLRASQTRLGSWKTFFLWSRSKAFFTNIISINVRLHSLVARSLYSAGKKGLEFSHQDLQILLLRLGCVLYCFFLSSAYRVYGTGIVLEIYLAEGLLLSSSRGFFFFFLSPFFAHVYQLWGSLKRFPISTC